MATSWLHGACGVAGLMYGALGMHVRLEWHVLVDVLLMSMCVEM